MAPARRVGEDSGEFLKLLDIADIPLAAGDVRGRMWLPAIPRVTFEGFGARSRACVQIGIRLSRTERVHDIPCTRHHLEIPPKTKSKTFTDRQG